MRSFTAPSGQSPQEKSDNLRPVTNSTENGRGQAEKEARRCKPKYPKRYRERKKDRFSDPPTNRLRLGLIIAILAAMVVPFYYVSTVVLLSVFAEWGIIEFHPNEFLSLFMLTLLVCLGKALIDVCSQK